MKYLIEFPPTNPFAHANPTHLAAGKARLEAALKDGSIDCFYSKVGGGGFLVANSSSHEALRRVLRTNGVVNVQITPVTHMADVIDGYIDYHKKGAPEPQVVKHIKTAVGASAPKKKKP
jgi:hypothetical protein